MKTLLFTLLLSASWIGAAPAADEPPSSLLHWFSFDEGQGDKVADSKGGATGTIKGLGDKVQWAPGKRGNALKFILPPPGTKNGVDAYGCMEVPVPTLRFADGFTVEAWVCPSAKGLAVRIIDLISNAGNDRGPGFRLRLFESRLSLLSGDSRKYWETPSTSGTLVPDTWVHVAATWDKSIFRIYQNGVEVGTSKDSTLLTRGREILTIGAYNSGYAYGLDGLMDEVKIYTAALTPEEILKAAKDAGAQKLP